MKSENNFTRNRRRRTSRDVSTVLEANGMKVLAGEYSNNHSPLRCQCAKCGFVWITNFNRVQQGHGCRKCGNRFKSLKLRFPENFVRQFLADHSIVLLGDYQNSKSPLPLRCGVCGNEWRMRFNNVQQGQGCPKCGIRRRADSHLYSESDVRQFFKQRGITLAGKYAGSEKPTACRCDKCGYEWNPCYSSIRQGAGCPRCSGCARITSRDYEKLASHHGGIVLIQAKTGERKSTWRCSSGHVFQRSYESIRQLETFCTVCSCSRRYSEEDYAVLAAEHGGKLKQMARTTQLPSLWICRRGHEFARSYTKIQTNGNFCPVCSRGLAERQCKAALEQIFRVPFKKVKLKQLRGIGGGMLEFDLYNDELKLALEHQGLQHYKPVRFGRQTHAEAEKQFQRQRLHDQMRREFCREQGIAFIEIKDLGNYTPIDQLKEVIRNACLRQRVHMPVDFDEIVLDLKSVTLKTNEEEMWNRIRLKAAGRGFEVVSKTYLGSQVPHEFLCKNGHVFKKRPYALFNGQGCQECYHLALSTPIVLSDGRMFKSVRLAAQLLKATKHKITNRLVRGTRLNGIGFARISRQQFECFQNNAKSLLAFAKQTWPEGGEARFGN